VILTQRLLHQNGRLAVVLLRLWIPAFALGDAPFFDDLHRAADGQLRLGRQFRQPRPALDLEADFSCLPVVAPLHAQPLRQQVTGQPLRSGEVAGSGGLGDALGGQIQPGDQFFLRHLWGWRGCRVRRRRRDHQE